ncbi:MAG: amino acid permease [Myxococcales bacterium]|nr:amino acid permease [Myxococcales bacterium]
MSSSQLERRLGAVDAAALLVGSMIGSGIFIAPSLMAKNIAAPGIYLGLWGLAGLFTLLGALSYAELAAMMPEAGGQYVYLRRAFGRLPGFLYGWTLFLVIQSGFVAAVAIAFAKYLGIFLPWVGEERMWLTLYQGSHGPVGISSGQAVALVVIAVLTYINTRGVVAGAAVQNLFTGLKLLALWALIALILILGNGHVAHFVPVWSTDVPRVSGAVSAGFLAALGVAASKALFCYDAWNTVTFAAAEVRDPARSLPRALIAGTLVTTLTYVLAAAGYLYLVPLSQMAQVPENRIAAEAAQRLLGSVGGQLIAAAILVSTFGCINGMILGGARVLFAMAEDGLFFRRAGQLNQRRAPSWALVMLGLWSAVLTMSGKYDDLLTYTTFASLLFNAATAACVLVLRRRLPDAARPYRALGYPVSTVAFILVALGFVVYIVQGDPRSSLYGLGLVLLGVPAYFLVGRESSSLKSH